MLVKNACGVLSAHASSLSSLKQDAEDSENEGKQSENSTTEYTSSEIRVLEECISLISSCLDSLLSCDDFKYPEFYLTLSYILLAFGETERKEGKKRGKTDSQESMNVEKKSEALVKACTQSVNFITSVMLPAVVSGRGVCVGVCKGEEKEGEKKSETLVRTPGCEYARTSLCTLLLFARG